MDSLCTPKIITQGFEQGFSNIAARLVDTSETLGSPVSFSMRTERVLGSLRRLEKRRDRGVVFF